ncbi:pentatricopeptide repeat-containing protein At1g59720, chloroplastic/mitochondrial [Sorghum bicolor]|uniref:pentatricopeptide repeat-containing protein At1g59720, chloroplastic/mitochondrial n=1 Tax=Sorghum bicolor TaxID=4558 RepID=UPI000B424AE3|nr:pentatricopeptide repeat-containing protein At1g59720, chloroplastic/mitochondrial [Sorghum bicolor]|eukprot:XP_021303174.1 pentatricopeptide repeat-containing protein At1g59720, chloroplastic/mitochondrial [Sorghum bicolor]
MARTLAPSPFLSATCAARPSTAAIDDHDAHQRPWPPSSHHAAPRCASLLPPCRPAVGHLYRRPLRRQPHALPRAHVACGPVPSRAAPLPHAPRLRHLSPPRYSLPSALSVAAFLATLPEGRQLHALAAKLGLLAPARPHNNTVVVTNSLVHLYTSCGRSDAALAIFRGVPDADRLLVSWNTTIDTIAGNGDHLAALDLFREMQRDRPELAPDAYTLQSVLGAYAAVGVLSLRLYAHAVLLRELGAGGGHASSPAAVSRVVLINNVLVDLYGKCGTVELARQVFDQMPEQDLASWNAMVLALANHGCVRDSLDLFHRMTHLWRI